MGFNSSGIVKMGYDKVYWDKKEVVDNYNYSSKSDRDKEVFENRYFLKQTLPYITEYDSVLDVGCACGGFCGVLSKYFKRVDYWGIDISSSMIQEAILNYPLGIFRVGDVCRIPYKNSFDKVLCNDVLIHVGDWRKGLKELIRVSHDKLIIGARFKLEEKTIVNLSTSYELLENGERAYYNIFNIREFVSEIRKITQADILLNGYYMPLDKSVYYPYDRWCISGVMVLDFLNLNNRLSLNIRSKARAKLRILKRKFLG